MLLDQSVSSQFQLHQKIALVTGGSSGIGKAIAIAFAKAGARVIIVGRNSHALAEVQACINDNNEPIKILKFDFSQKQVAIDCAHAALSIYGDVDILVNAAGINLRQPASEITFDSWEETLQVNISTPFFLAREIAKNMQKNGSGKIINISSLQSRRAFEQSMAYGATKGGIDQLTRAMAQEWSPFGICCNALAPGFFPTNLTSPVFADEAKVKSLAAKTALGRNGTLEDITGPAIFLASAASNYITGQTLFVDGGFSAL